ncbi:MAG TPA: DUF4232 domain-containing protein [Ktedonobacteraceae bacterium]|jgi:hypothetical protein
MFKQLVSKEALPHSLSWTALACLAIFFLAGCQGIYSAAAATPTEPTPQSSPTPSASAPCQTQNLLLAFDTFGAATSNEGLQLALVNQSKQSCTLSGYPELQLLDAQHQPIQTQIKQVTQGFLYPQQLVSHQFILQAGGKAYFVVAWANEGCGQAFSASPVSFLQVTPPLNQAPLQIARQFCAFRNYVEISPLEPDKILG